MSRGLSPIIATIIIVGVAITVSILVALWFSGVVGYFTRVESVKVTEMYSFGPAVVVYFYNSGTKESYISECWINGKYRARIVAAYDPSTHENYLYSSAMVLWLSFPQEAVARCG